MINVHGETVDTRTTWTEKVEHINFFLETHIRSESYLFCVVQKATPANSLNIKHSCDVNRVRCYKYP